MDGRAHDRLLFDLLASEHESFEETRRARKSRSLQDTLRQNGDEDAGAELHSENHPTPLRALATAGSGAGLEIQPG
jgi:hypothetical protein